MLTPMSGLDRRAVGSRARAGSARRGQCGRAAALAMPPIPTSANRPAIRFGDQVWTHARVLRRVVPVRDPVPRAAARTARHRHVAVLLDNTPDYLFAFGGAALDRRRDRRAQPHTSRRAPPTRRRAHALRAGDHRTPARGACSRRSPTACRRSSRRPVSPIPAIRNRHSATSLGDALARHVGDADPGHRTRRRRDLGADLHVGHLRRAQGRHLLATAAARDGQAACR